MRMKGSIMKTTVDDLTERVQVVYREKQRDERGALLDGEEHTRCMVWAKVYPYANRNETGGVELSSEVDYRVVLRFRTDILPDDEVLWRNKRLRIIRPAYDAESARIWTVLDCREVMPDGKAAQSL